MCGRRTVCFCRRSFVLQSPQLQINAIGGPFCFGRRSFLLRLSQSPLNFVRRTLVLRSRHSQKFLVTPGTKNASVGGHLFFALVNREKNPVGGHFCFSRTSRKNFRSRQAQKHFVRWSFVLQSPLLQKYCGRGTLLIRSAETYALVTPVAKMFWCARRENSSVGG